MSNLIIGFVNDLLFTSKIEIAARHLGYELAWVATAEQFGTEQIADLPGEHIAGGQLTELMRYVTDRQPALLLFDLANGAIPAAQWIALLKSSPATRRLPILCFGPHVATEQLKAAHNAGADGVVTRGRFTSQLPDLLQQHARQIPTEALKTGCEQPLSALAMQGIAQFNAGQYYDAHHELEAAWNADQTPTRELYRAILQVSVAYYQIERGNYRGAVKMFLRAWQWLTPLPDSCRGVNVAQLREDAQAIYARLIAGGEKEVAQFKKGDFPPIQMVDAH